MVPEDDERQRLDRSLHPAREAPLTVHPAMTGRTRGPERLDAPFHGMRQVKGVSSRATRSTEDAHQQRKHSERIFPSLLVRVQYCHRRSQGRQENEGSYCESQQWATQSVAQDHHPLPLVV